MSRTTLEEEPQRGRADSDVGVAPSAHTAVTDATIEAQRSFGATGSARSPSPPRTLIDIFTATALRCADKTAIDAPDAVLTYRDLREAATRLGRQLRGLGFGPGDRIGVRVPSGTADLYIAILGVLFAGAAYVPVDADDPQTRAEELWGRAEVAAVVGKGLSITIRGRPDLPRGEVNNAQTIVHTSEDAWVIFTSGSTGKPKGVAVSHRAAAAFVDAEAQLWAIDVEDRVLAGLSVGFDASCEEMWLAWRHGATLVPAPRSVVRSGADLADWIADRGITVVSTVPTLAAMWDQDALASVRLLILGGEAAPESLAWRLAEDREVWNTYGPTEATVVSTARQIRPGESVTIGWPLSGWETAVLAPNGEPAAIGEDGELVIAGVGLGRYLEAALDEERFCGVESLDWDRAYRTGDIVRETIHGLAFVGRRDDQVKIGGRRIELGEVDARLSSIPGVRAAATTVRETDAGNKLLVAYVVGDLDPEQTRSRLAELLPSGVAPLIVPLPSLPQSNSGKVDREALPWPPPATSSSASLLGTAEWVAELWCEQLGRLALTTESDFFELGGSSLAVAKLVSALRARFPAVAVADVYEYRRLGELSARLERLGELSSRTTRERPRPPRGWASLQLIGVFMLELVVSPLWLLGVLAINRLTHGQLGPELGWGWLIAGWVVFASAPGRALLLLLARKTLLRDLRPGRFPRHSWLMFRIWLVERLAARWRRNRLEGTPWAARYARLCGHRVGRGARLFTLPSVTSLVSIGEGATLEAHVDIEGWWIEGDELVIGELRVGNGARVGTQSVLMPGAEIEAEAEVEPGGVVSGTVPAGERWAGSPARKLGPKASSWPATDAPPPTHRHLWQAMYGVGLAAQNAIAIAAAAPSLLLILALAPDRWTPQGLAVEAIVIAPLIVLTFMLAYALLVALLVGMVARLLRTGWHPEEGATRWALWLTDSLLESANVVLFPLFMSVYTRFWLRLLGLRVGKRAEVSVTSGLNRLTTLGEMSFVADMAVFAVARSRKGWLHVSPIHVGSGSFLGNSAIVAGSTDVGDRCLVGVLTSAPGEVPEGTSWFGCPALELPQRPGRIDRARTTQPSRRLIAARGATEVVRILLPASLSVALGSLLFAVLERIGSASGLLAMTVATPFAFVAGGLCAMALTIALKWLLMGRYRSGEHPLWSFFVWRDEIMNTCQEQLAGPWLIESALATPLMSAYLRLMGASVGRDVWCDTMTITEFDMVSLGDGSVVNRNGLIDTHLFHDRLMRIGPAVMGQRSTLGPIGAMLPDSTIGDGSCVGARSVVMRGEQLPPQTRWHGSPVVAA